MSEKNQTESAIEFLDKWIDYCKKSDKISLAKTSAVGDVEFIASVKENARAITHGLQKAISTENINKVKINTIYTFDDKFFPGALDVTGNEIVIKDIPAFIECVKKAAAFEAFTNADDGSVKLEFSLEGAH